MVLTPKKKDFPFVVFYFLIVLICFSIVFSFWNFWVKASPEAKVQFTADTEIILTDLDTNLYVLGDPVSPSECDSLTIGDPDSKTLKVDIPDASSFTLKTTTNNVLRLTPAGGTVSLTFSSDYFSSGYVNQWTASSSVTNAQVSFLVGVSETNADYLVKVDGSNLGYYLSNSSGEVTFTYSSGFPSKIFTITREDRPSPVPGGAGPILPPVSTTGSGNISQSLGGQVSKTFESGQIAKTVFPSGTISGTAVVKIEPQNKTEVIKTNPLPENTQIVGDLVADFKALSGGKEIESFEKEVPITFTYTDSQIKEAGVDEETLKIYWWDEATSSWQVLPSSKVNTATNSVTASTLHFALFAVMGEIKEEPIEEIIKEVPAVVYKGIPAGFTFEKNLKYGDKNDDVKYLQIILKTETPETYPAEVPATSWFGPITKASVVAFQEKYAEDVLTPWGLTTGTGYVGKTTRAKLSSLLAAVPTEEKEVVPEILEIPADYKFTTDLKYDQTNDEVKYLQIFLKAQGTEIYPEGIISGWFGPLTKKAVIRFQEKYAEDVLTPWGLTKGTGFVGETTRAKISEILGY